MAADLTRFAGRGKGDAKLDRERKGSVNHTLWWRMKAALTPKAKESERLPICARLAS
jgi:hypothetical protein